MSPYSIAVVAPSSRQKRIRADMPISAPDLTVGAYPWRRTGDHVAGGYALVGVAGSRKKLKRL
jgi:hypothetical protein